MGSLASIAEKSLSQTTENFWDSLPECIFPKIDLDTSEYDQGFVDLCVLVGIYATSKAIVQGTKKLSSIAFKNKELSQEKFIQRYGEQSWAVIADVHRNQEFCLYLAAKGVNLILLGQDGQINSVRENVRNKYEKTRFVLFPVDWSRRDFNFQRFANDVKDYDISFLILPRLSEVDKETSFGTHVNQLPYYERYYMMIRYLGPILQWRSYHSAIILPSVKNVGQIKLGFGVEQAFNSAADAIMRTLNYQMKENMDVITARGTVEQCFKDLGKQPISL